MIKENGYFYTGIRATEEQERSMKAASLHPVIVVHGELLPSMEEVVHALAIHNGLPDIVGFYGYDFREHEFIRLPDADQGTPDAWPSRKIEDILKRVSA